MVRHPVDLLYIHQCVSENRGKMWSRRINMFSFLSVCFSLNTGSSEVLIEGDLVFPKTRNALKCFNNNCFWKKNSNNIAEIPYTVSGEFCE